jgi:predicted AlkP superfamily phosphohydrolase/phosphomutase
MDSLRYAKVFVVGIDGAPYDLARRWAEEGRLPTIARLMAEGAHGVLKSVVPPLSVPAWPCMLTGKSPGTLGIYQFVERRNGSYQLKPVSLDWRRWDPLWSIVARHQKRVIMVNVPTVSASDGEPTGVYVTGPIMSSRYVALAHPPGLAEYLSSAGYHVEPAFPAFTDGRYLRTSLDLIRRRHDLMTKLLREEFWDFFMGVFFRPDQVMHRYWRYMDENHPAHTQNQFSSAILTCYQQIDGHLSDLLAMMPPDCHILLVSDHGHGPLYSQVDLNAWLEREGFLVLRDNAASILDRRALAQRLHVFRGELTALAGWLATHRGLSGAVGLAKRAIPPESKGADAVRWDQTVAYTFGTGVIYINLRGREPQGSVSPADYDEVRESIINRLHAFTDESGRPVVQRAIKGEALYPAADSNARPDVVIEFASESNFVNSSGSVAPGARLFPGGIHTSAHTTEGFLVARGPGIPRGHELPESNIVDIMPTVLGLMGIASPSDLDGRPIADLVTTEMAGRPREWPQTTCPRGKGGGYGHDEEREIMNTLRGLGYLQ